MQVPLRAQNMPSFTCFISALVILVLIQNGQTASPYSPPLEQRLNNFENANDRVKQENEHLNYRLPNQTYPEHYAIELTTNVHTGERAFKGKVTIDVVVVETTSEMVIHARQLKDFSAILMNPTTGSTEYLKSDYEIEREFLTLTRLNGNQFLADSKWKVTITYSGELRTDNGGFYLSSYTNEQGETRYLATTQFSSTNARHAFPCYDEPAKRANFTITMIHSPTYHAISNMPVNEALSSPGKTVFLATDKMPTYLVAFIVSDFAHTDGTLNGLPHRIYYRAGTQNSQEWSLISGMLLIERLQEYYGVKFMLPKLDQATIPDFAPGAMENWGLVTFREENALYNKETSTIYTQTKIANVMAHEFCHLWFGDYVTLKWWSYLWLKEGFASLFAYKGLDAVYPEWGVWQEYQVTDYQTALSRDATNNSRPMTNYVETPQEIAQNFDSVSYAKSGAVLHMWNNALTDKVFQRSLHNYLVNNKYNSADEDQVFAAVQQAAKEENYILPATAKEMISSWTRQGGYPLLTVTRNYNDGSFTVKQEAFYNDVTFKSNKTWFIPFNFAFASKADYRDTEATHYLLNVTKVKVDQLNIPKDDWLLLNKQSTGYYRINYDEANWKLISKGLKNKHYEIHPRNRAQLMHDAYRFCSSQRLSHDILLDMMTYLTQEDQYAPWATASEIITTYNRYLSGDADYKLFQAFVTELVANIFAKLGVNDDAGEQHYQKYTRYTIINMACLAGIEECLDKTYQKLKDLVKQNIAVEPNLQAAVYCNGLKQSNDEEFDFLYNKLMDSTDQAERRILISTLGCSQKENHIKKFISSSIDKSNKLRIQERYLLLGPTYTKGEVGLLTCIDFLNENWQAYGSLKGGFSGSNPLDDDLRGMASYVINKEQEDKLLALVAKVKGSEYVTKTLEDDVKKSIKGNYDWLEINRGPLVSWLKNYQGNDGGDGSDGGNGAASLTVSFIILAAALILAVSHVF